MASISSRTAYVILAAIEDEMRSIVDSYAGDSNPSELLGKQMLDAAQDRRKREGLSSVPHAVGPLLPYLDFQDGFQLIMKLGPVLPKSVSSGIKEVGPTMIRAVPVRNRVAHNRPLEIDDLPTVMDLADELIKVQGWDWSSLNRTLSEIRKDPGYIFRVSANLPVDPDTTIANNLPAPDFDETSLLGRKEECRSLHRALRGSWPVISILGDGGIGKTALALQVCYELIADEACPFEVVVWVSAKNSQLTSTEIVRIETSIEDSLGLFGSAAAEFGSAGTPNTAIERLTEILGSFPTLLVLDNVETVLDESFPQFLREVPVGSKVLITSRIGVKTENPFKITGLSEDDAIRLMRILAKSRRVDLTRIATDTDLRAWAQKMKCHPAYIKWFISGVQSGQTPEKLLNDNGLVLDFCMSNVFGYLSEPSRATLRAMIVVPGAHTMAELATLTQQDSSTIQEIIQELTSTNFVIQVRGGASGTALELSDFAREYLRRKLRIDEDERHRIVDRHKHLYLIGGGLKQAHLSNPYDPATVDIRGAGDYSAAKLLRDAVEYAVTDRVDKALQLCSEASELAPGYHEVARVEAYVHELSANYWEASDSYSRARDLAPDDPYVAFALGKFLVGSGFDPTRGIKELQRAAKLDPTSPDVQRAITSAFAKNSDYQQAMYAAAFAVKYQDENLDRKAYNLFLLWQNCALAVAIAAQKKNWSGMAEDAESAWNACDGLSNSVYGDDTLDLMLWVEEQLGPATDASAADTFIANRASALVAAIKNQRLRVSSDHSDRMIGTVKLIKEEGGYGFLKRQATDYFFHARELWEREWFESLQVGSVLAFTVDLSTPSQGRPAARSIHWLS